ncbi:M1 family metallopeptidase [Paraurantiacibacter namhicola]|uniref:Aminopeptidase N n=1 Tax=Paraurantiacibacter namhicola TaxID=645517 RepID=A0A1C7D5I7_9SPHN|nr:M1 family metallopeptidase [Paraurantiacibacter namhicola]ANU06718.1 Aminopeptidase N [Paraurantiacibacter namhicola]
MRQPLRITLLAGLAAAMPMGMSAAQDTAEAQAEPIRTLVSGTPLTSEQAKLVPLKLDLKIWVMPETTSIRGLADYTFAANGTPKRVELELDERLAVSQVMVGGMQIAPGSFTHADGLLSIELPESRRDPRRYSVQIQYEGVPREAPRAPWDGGFVWSQTPDGQPWIATAMQGHGCDLLYPCIDHSTKEIAEVESTIFVPSDSNLYAAGNGRLLGEETAGEWRGYRWLAKHPNIYAMALNIGPYEVLERTHRGPSGQDIPLVFYHLPGDGENAGRLLDELALYIDWFERRIGPYPFADEKAGVVHTPHLGMEHQTINAYGNGYKRGVMPYDWLLFHEFAHEWFANQLTHRSNADMWLHEGTGSYMEALYLRDIAGEHAYHAKMAGARNIIRNQVPVAPRDHVRSDAYLDDAGWGSDIYAKGSWVLHTLRELIGDDAFFRSMTLLVYDTFDPQPGRFMPVLRDTDDLLQIAEEESGLELGWFFEVYLRQAALPDLVATRDGGTLALEWRDVGNVEFAMPVEVMVDGQLMRAEFTGNRAVLEIGEDAQIVTLDPQSKILRRDPNIEAYQAQQARARAGT